jgi:hypothetical protein
MSVSFPVSINEFLLVIPLHHIVFLCVPLFSYWFIFSFILFQSCHVLNVYLYCVPLSMSIKNLHLCLRLYLCLCLHIFTVFLFLSVSVILHMPGHVFMLSVSNRFQFPIFSLKLYLIFIMFLFSTFMFTSLRFSSYSDRAPNSFRFFVALSCISF